MQNNTKPRPLILAPAGSKVSFLAALAAGADAVYCGLKSFSARMEADNFTMEELAPLVGLAHEKGTKVYITLNSLVKPGELEMCGKLLDQLNSQVKPDAIIIQDLAFAALARQTGFAGEIHLSTLANVSFPEGVKKAVKDHGVKKVVIPRELNIDEIKAMSAACPEDASLEIFLHGALCYGVSGRCYWSSYLGGKSGLRGRCVQPCRRVYSQKNQSERFFSCQDLSVDVLAKVLLTIPEISTWKIEGRKKGPHYVYYTVSAYKLLRDHGNEPEMKRRALSYLEQALGRHGTHYNFLPQRPQPPVSVKTHTGSGMLVGTIKGGKQKTFIIPRENLLAGDLLRIGYEDSLGHSISKVTKSVPKKGRLYLKVPSKNIPLNGTPVFLIDRREKGLSDLIRGLEKELARRDPILVKPSDFTVRLPKKGRKPAKPFEMVVRRKAGRGKAGQIPGLWMSASDSEHLPKKNTIRGNWWWLPPVVWPDDEQKLRESIGSFIKRGGRNFVLNAPWQTAFFPKTKGFNLWAGPFCNIANHLSIKAMSDAGFSGVIVSPELGSEDYYKLPKHSPLPLGIVISGNWPFCISRTVSEDIKTSKAFTSPRGEKGWVKKYFSDYWVYPNWILDIKKQREVLMKAGYSLFVHMEEHLPKGVQLKQRPGKWNWDVGLR